MIGTIARFIVSALVILLVGRLLPGFNVAGFTGALVAAVTITVIGFAVEKLMGRRISPRSRGLVGFVTSAAVIYLAQFIIPGFLSVSLIGAVLAAFVVGVIDSFVPIEIR